MLHVTGCEIVCGKSSWRAIALKWKRESELARMWSNQNSYTLQSLQVSIGTTTLQIFLAISKFNTEHLQTLRPNISIPRYVCTRVDPESSTRLFTAVVSTIAPNWRWPKWTVHSGQTNCHMFLPESTRQLNALCLCLCSMSLTILNERRQTPKRVCWMSLCIKSTRPGKTQMYS